MTAGVWVGLVARYPVPVTVSFCPISDEQIQSGLGVGVIEKLGPDLIVARRFVCTTDGGLHDLSDAPPCAQQPGRRSRVVKSFANFG